MALPKHLQSALHKYAFDPKNPTGAGLPASATAPKPPSPLPKGLTEQAQSMFSSGPAGGAKPLMPPQPKPTGLASASIGAAPNQNALAGMRTAFTGAPGNTNNAIFGQQPAMPSANMATLANSPTNSAMPAASPTLSLAGAAPSMSTLTTGGSAPAGPLPTPAPTPTPQTSAPLPAMGTLSLNNPAGSEFSPAVTLSGGSTGNVNATVPGQETPATQTSAPAPQAQQAQQTPKPQQAQPGFSQGRAQWADRYGRDAQGNALPPTHPEAQKAVTASLTDKNIPEAQRTEKGKQVLQDTYAAAPAEDQKAVQDLAAGNADTPEAKQFKAQKVEAAGQQYVKDEYAKATADKPATTPQEAGGIMNGIMESWNNMPEPMKWMMGLGLGGGLLGVLGGMFGGGGGMGLLGVLGLGAAGLAGAAGGMFGQGAQDMMGSALGSIGQATGMIPKDMDLSALKGNDAVGKAVSDSSGGGIIGGLKAWWDPKGTAKAVQGKLDSAGNLQRLMSVPEGMRAGLMRQISPNSSPEEIQQMLANAKSLHGAMNDPKHQLAQNMAKGREFAADPEKYIRNNSWLGSAVGSSLTDPDQRGWAADMAAYSNPITGTATGLYDMGRNLYEGDWWGVGRGALNTASSFIPGGSLLKGLGRAGLQGVSHMMKPASDQRAITLAQQWAKEARCWKGYEPVPGKAPYSENSCRPIGSKKKKKKTEKTAEEVADEWLKKYRARGQKGRWVNTRRGSKTELKVSTN